MKADFDSLTPSQREVILVASDETYEKLVNGVDWPRVGITLAALASAAPLVIWSPRVGGAAASLLLRGASDLSWKGLFAKRQEIAIPHLSPAEAKARFRFDIDGPKDGTAYLLNPCVADNYLLPARANERLAQEKLAAFIQVAAALGAKAIHVLSGEIVSSASGGSAGTSLAGCASKIGLKVAIDGECRIERQACAKFDRPRGEPHVPDECWPWLDADPILRAVVNARLRGRLSRIEVVLEFGRMLRAAGDLAAELAGKGIEVGGKASTHSETKWNFELEFWPRSGGARAAAQGMGRTKPK